MSKITERFSPAAPAIDPAAELDEASREHDAVSARLTELDTGIAARRLAVALTASPSSARRTPARLRDAAEPYFDDARLRPAKIENDIRELEIERGRVVAALQVARDRYEMARRRMTTAIATTLVPRHERALIDVAHAVEALSAAIAAERAVRRELGQLAPYRQSPLLPGDLVEDLQVGEISEHGSRARRFAERMRQSGLLR